MSLTGVSRGGISGVVRTSSTGDPGGCYCVDAFVIHTYFVISTSARRIRRQRAFGALPAASWRRFGELDVTNMSPWTGNGPDSPWPGLILSRTRGRVGYTYSIGDSVLNCGVGGTMTRYGGHENVREDLVDGQRGLRGGGGVRVSGLGRVGGWPNSPM